MLRHRKSINHEICDLCANCELAQFYGGGDKLEGLDQKFFVTFYHLLQKVSGENKAGKT